MPRTIVRTLLVTILAATIVAVGLQESGAEIFTPREANRLRPAIAPLSPEARRPNLPAAQASPTPDTPVARARLACPVGATTRCRSALVRALRAVDWQRQARWRAQARTVRAITIDAIQWAAKRYGVSATAMERVGNCESHLWPFATNGQYLGWAQLSRRHRADKIFSVVPWQDAYAVASHMARYVKAHGYSEWQCRPDGGLRW